MARISDLAANNQLIGYILNTQARMHSYQAQVSSEKRSSTYSGISRDSQYLVTLENARKAIDSFKTNNELMDFRLQVTETTMGGMNDTVREMISTIRNFSVGENPPKSDIDTLQQWAFDSMVSMESFLNTQADGRYIYSGAKVSTEPVNLGLDTLSRFQQKYDGKAVTYATTRDMHLADFSLSKDTNNENQMFINGDNWLTFRRDDDGIGLTGGNGSIEATSAMFSNVVVGSTITVTDTANNDGIYTIDSVSSDGTKAYVRTAMLTDERLLDVPVTDETLDSGITTDEVFAANGVTTDENNVAGTITEVVSGTAYAPGATTDLTFNAAGNTITAFVANTLSGITVGELITVTGTASNDATYEVTAIDAASPTTSQLTVSKVEATVTASGSSALNAADFGDLTFNDAGNTLTAAIGGGFSSLSVGNTITVAGTISNNGTYEVTVTDGTTMTLAKVDATITLNDDSVLNATDYGTLTFDAATSTIVSDTAGAFATVTAESIISINNSFANDGLFSIDAVSADGQTITLLNSDSIAMTYGEDKTVITDTGDLTFDRATGTITTTATDTFLAVKEGDILAVTGTGENNGTFVVKSISADYKTITIEETKLTDEGVNTGNKFFDYSTGTKTVFTQAAGTIQAQTAGGAALTGAFSNLLAGDSITVAGTDVSPTLLTQIDFDNAGAVGTHTIQIQDNASAAALGYFSDIQAGDTVSLAGSAVGNNVAYTVNWVSEDGSQVMVDEDVGGLGADTNSISVTGAATFTTQLHLDFDDNGATDRIYLRDDFNNAIANSFDDMSVGMQITIVSSTSNNGTYEITAVDASGYIDIELVGGGDPLITDEDSIATTTITASGNDATYTIDSVSSDGSTITVAGATPLVADQTDADGTKITASGFSLTTGARLYLDAAADTIKLVEKGSGATVTDAFDNLRVGQRLGISNTTNNNFFYTVATNAAGVITTTEDITASEGDPSADLSVYGAVGAVSAQSYYRGDTNSLGHRLDETRNFNFDLTAVDPAFEKALRAMGILAQGAFGADGGLDNNIDRVEEALWLLQSATSSDVSSTPPYGSELTNNMNDIGTNIGFKRVLIQEVTNYHKEFIAFSENRIADKENVDMTEAVTKLLDESQALEAAYQAMSRIQGLTFANFL